MVELIELIFPALVGREYRVTSPEDDQYNCIGWAAGDTNRWWWPRKEEPPGKNYWPAGIPRAETLETFRDAFATIGHVVCNDDRVEVGYEKIALFALQGVPKHASRQLSNGRWTSKLGPNVDIEHELHDLTGIVYGSVVMVMKRPAPPSGEDKVGRV